MGQGDVDEGLHRSSVACSAERHLTDPFERLLPQATSLREYCLVQRLLAREVVQQPGPGQAHGVRDVLHRGLGEPAPGEQRSRLVEDLLVDLVAGRDGSRRRR